MIVTLSPEARDDLVEIGEWIGRDNPARAETFVDELLERCRSLTDLPERFPITRLVGSIALRKLTHGNYLVFYSVGQEEVDVVRIVHGARDWVAILVKG